MSHPTTTQQIGNVTAQDGSKIFIGLQNPSSSSSARDPRALLSTLPSASSAAFDHITKQDDPLCLPGTREEVLRRIFDWTHAESSDDDASSIFWLNGMAGTGKSTIARTVADRLSEEGSLGASFFFAKGAGEVAHAGLFFTTIARQLGAKFEGVREHLARVLVEEENIVGKKRGYQWKRLVVEGLENLGGEEGEGRALVVVVVDALDECEGESDVAGIISLLAGAGRVRRVRLRVIVTSRPEMAVRAEFRRKEIVHQTLVLHDQPREVVDGDIRRFFEYSFERTRRRQDWLPTAWPGDQVVDRLVVLADSLFIFAATICRFVDGSSESADQALSIFLFDQSTKLRDHAGSTIHLDRMYGDILRQAISAAISQTKNLETILGAIAVMSEPLTTRGLSRLLDISEGTLRHSLHRLHSVIHVPLADDEPIRLYHASFRDFLLDPERCSATGQEIISKTITPFALNPNLIHAALASTCLRLLSKNLRRDICSVSDPGCSRIALEPQVRDNAITVELSYACRYWVTHVEERGRQTGLNDIDEFIMRSLLHWIEVLSWLGAATDSIIYIERLCTLIMSQQMVAVVHDLHLGCLPLLLDAKRFVSRNISLITDWPLQIYYSALLFSPTQSLIRRHFEGEMTMKLDSIPPLNTDWDSELFTHDVALPLVLAASGDGRRLASGSADGSLRVWDTSTGKPLLRCHAGPAPIKAIAFLADKHLRAFDGSRVTTWSLATGEASNHAVYENVQRATFSPEGKLLAVCFHEMAVDCLDENGQMAFDTIKSSVGIKAMSVSFNKRVIAIVYDDSTVLLQDLIKGQSLHRLRPGTLPRHPTIEISSSGDLVAATVSINEIRIWDVLGGNEVQNLRIKGEDQNYVRRAIAFAPNRNILAAATSVGSVQIWNTKTGEHIQYLTDINTSLRVVSIVFVLDGHFVATATRDGTVRVWMTGNQQNLVEGSLGTKIDGVTFSKDGSKLESFTQIGYDTYKSTVWSVATGEKLAKYGARKLYGRQRSMFFKGLPQSAFLPDRFEFLESARAIKYNGQEVIRLPREYDVTCKASNAHLLALGLRSGRMAVINLEPSAVTATENLAGRPHESHGASRSTLRRSYTGFDEEDRTDDPIRGLRRMRWTELARPLDIEEDPLERPLALSARVTSLSDEDGEKLGNWCDHDCLTSGFCTGEYSSRCLYLASYR